MSTYPGSSRLLKGAIVAVNDNMQPPNVIAFRYNPEGVRRSLQPQTAGGGQGERSQLVRYIGAPVETFDLEIHLDGVDELVGDETTIQYGIYPQLAALEMLVYPGSQQVIQNDALLSSGILEIAPIAAPLTLLVWGPNRVLPVQLTALSVSEELFTPNLNPIQATVSLSMRALSYSDLAPGTRGYNLFLAYQRSKESMASQAPQGPSSSTIAQIGVDIH